MTDRILVSQHLIAFREYLVREEKSAATVSLPPSGHRTLQGTQLKDGMFKFQIYAADDSFATQGSASQTVTGST